MVDLEENVRLPEEVEGFDPKDADGKFRVVAIGDSITECGNMMREERWTGILERLLGPDVQVINSGIGGTSSSLGLYRWRRDVSPMKPHAVVICFLLNDSHIRHYECASSYVVQCTPDRMRSNMHLMFDLSLLLGAEPVLWTPPPVPTWGSHDVRMQIQMNLLHFYEAVLEDVTRERDVKLVNFWRTFPGMVDEFPGIYFKEPDGYHSTVAAQPLLAQGIAQALQGAYRKWKASDR